MIIQAYLNGYAEISGINQHWVREATALTAVLKVLSVSFMYIKSISTMAVLSAELLLLSHHCPAIKVLGL